MTALIAALLMSHGVDMALLEVQTGDPIAIRWVAKPGVDARLELPESCSRAGLRVVGDARTFTLSCDLESLTVGGTADVVVRLNDETGRLFTAGQRIVPLANTEASGGFLFVGLRHMLMGWDHLAFVLALLLLVSGWRRLLVTITAFTVGHSVTLALAVTGRVVLPAAPVEACIALSVLLLAVELTHERETLTRRFPWLVAGAFGLLHGLGFAGALTEIGLPADGLLWALLSFNVGVELGQLAVAGAVLAGLRLVPRLPVRALAYGLGGLSAAWTMERVMTVVWV